MTRLKKILGSALLCGTAAVMALSVLAAAGCGGSPEPVDKSDLQYVDSLDGYKKTDWTAQWIWTDASIANEYVALRKTFTLKSVPDTAVADIAAESKYYLWVNGELVIYDGGSKNGPTEYDHYYEEKDLAPYLKTGDNVIVAMVSYNGRDGYSSVDPGAAGFLFEMDCGEQKIVSDKTFKVMRLKEYRNQSLLKWEYPLYEQYQALAEWNCYYDARYSSGDFTSPDFNDSKWDKATVVCKAGEQPFNDLYLSQTPFIDFDSTYTELESEYIGKTLTEDTTISIDMPYNMQFSPYFELNASEEGLRITYYTDTYKQNNACSFKDDYVTVAGDQTYESYPYRSGNTLIIEAPAGIKFTKIGFRKSGYASGQGGTFTAGDYTGDEDVDTDAVNTLWQKALTTLNICMRDNFMDCPERERAAYLADASMQMEETFYSLDTGAYALARKTYLTTLGWTGQDGLLPLRSPSSDLRENPVQGLAFLAAAYEYYLYTGDADTMKLFYPAAINYLKVWNMAGTGLVTTRTGEYDWTDWGSSIDEEVIQNCWYYYALTNIKALGDAIGITTYDTFLAERINSIAGAFDTQYWIEGSGYASSGSGTDDRANAMAVVCGLAGEDKYETIMSVLETRKNSSPYMEKFVLEAMCMMGGYDECLARMLDRYGDMIDDSCTTLWELWTKTSGTCNHGWSGGPLTVLSKYFGGISPLTAAYGSYEIRLNGTFGSLSTGVTTAAGKISYTMEKGNGGWTISLDTISGTGTLYIPESFGDTVTVNGTVQSAAAQDGFYAVSLSGGSYSVTVA